MAIRERATLKTWFKKYAYPKAEQFADWIDSFVHKNDIIPVQSVEDLTDLLNDKMDVATGTEIERKADEAIAGLVQQNEQIHQIIENTNEIEDRLDAHAEHLATHDGQITELLTTTEQHGKQIGVLETTAGQHSQKIGALETTTTQHGKQIGALETTTTQHGQKITALEGEVVGLKQADQQLRTDLGTETTARKDSDNQLNQSISGLTARVDALRGVFIYRGAIAYNTDAVTPARLNAQIQAICSRAPETGDVLKDNDGMEWYYSGAAWLKMGHDSLPLASNTVAGLAVGGAQSDLEYANGVATIKATKRIANPQKLAVVVGDTTHQYDGTQPINITIPKIEKPALANGTAEGTVKGAAASDLDYANGVATIKATKRIANPQRLKMLVGGQTYQYDGTQAIDIDLSDVGTGTITPEPEAANVYVIDSNEALAGLNDLDFSQLPAGEWFSELIIKVKAGTWVYDGNQHGNNGIFINTTSWYKEANNSIHHRAIQRVKIIGEGNARIVIRNAYNNGYMLKAGYLSQPHPATGIKYEGGINASVQNVELTFDAVLPTSAEREFFDCLQGFVGIENCVITGRVNTLNLSYGYYNLVGIPLQVGDTYCLSAINDRIYMRNTFINETKGHLVGYMLHHIEKGVVNFDIPIVIENCKIQAYRGAIHILNDISHWPYIQDSCALSVNIRDCHIVQIRKKYPQLWHDFNAAVKVFPFSFARTTIDGCSFLISGADEEENITTLAVIGAGIDNYYTSGTDILNSQFTVTGVSYFGQTILVAFINVMSNCRITNYEGWQSPIVYALGVRRCICNTFEGGGELNSVSTDGSVYQTTIDESPIGGFNYVDNYGDMIPY